MSDAMNKVVTFTVTSDEIRDIIKVLNTYDYDNLLNDVELTFEEVINNEELWDFLSKSHILGGRDDIYQNWNNDGFEGFDDFRK